MNIKIKKNSILNNKSVIINFVLIFIIILIIIFLIIFKIINNSNNNNNTNIEQFENYLNGINNVDKILFINLEDRTDRRDSILDQFNKYGVDKNKIHRINAHFTQGNGHLGCAKSHYDAIKYAIDNNLENIVVFEDDFTFGVTPDETNDLFNKLFNNVDKNEWDIIMFAHNFGKKSDTKYPFLFKITGAQDGSGYIVNKKYFKVLLDTFKKSVDNMKQDKTTDIGFEKWAIDQVWKENQKVDNWFVFNPILGKQNKELKSTIEVVTNYTV
jgi:GR25 family glycosyltransferase involved in LPS biosynthesis